MLVSIFSIYMECAMLQSLLSNNTPKENPKSYCTMCVTAFFIDDIQLGIKLKKPVKPRVFLVGSLKVASLLFYLILVTSRQSELFPNWKPA